MPNWYVDPLGLQVLQVLAALLRVYGGSPQAEAQTLARAVGGSAQEPTVPRPLLEVAS